MEFDLVFEGGGAKGLAFVGALQALEHAGHSPRRVIGTSAGSITALLVAAGYNAAECLAAINERTTEGHSRFATFLEIPQINEDTQINDSLRFWLKTELDNPLIPNLIEPIVDKMVEDLLQKNLTRHLISLLAFGGWFGGGSLLKYFQEKLDTNERNLGSTTLAEFSQRAGRDFSVVASDISGREMLVLNHRTAPDCPTIWAVRMSMSCPFAWQEVVWRKEWGFYRGRDLTGHTVVDGGLLSNFPIKLFLSDEEDVEEIMGKNSASESVIGLLLEDNMPVPGAENTEKKETSTPGILERSELLAGMMRRIYGMAETALSAHDKSVINAYQHMVCHLPAQGYGILEFDLTAERMAPILRAGEAAMEEHLHKRFDPGL
jgi:predicted acylesterase/phospholipase RssA